MDRKRFAKNKLELGITKKKLETNITRKPAKNKLCFGGIRIGEKADYYSYFKLDVYTK